MTSSSASTDPSGPPPTRPSKDLDIPLLVPHSAIGPFKLGATQEELVAAGHKLEQLSSPVPHTSLAQSGPYQLTFNPHIGLVSVVLDLAASELRVGEQIVSAKLSVEELLKVMGCGPLDVRRGGAIAQCNGAQLSQSGPQNALSVMVLVEAGEIVPAASIGPFKLGATQEELVAAGHKLEPHPSGQLGDAVRVSGPYALVFAQGVVSSVELSLDKAPARYKAQLITGKDEIESLRKLLECGPLEMLEGGNVATCINGLSLKQSGPTGLLSVQLRAAR